MDVYDTHEGNTDDVEPPAAAETVTVGEAERHRSRFRTRTDAGREVGVVVGRDLRSGDVLVGDGPPLVVALESVAAMAVGLEGSDDALAAAVLGHAAGNRHWELAVEDGRLLFSAEDGESRMRATVEPHLPAGATVEFTEVSPATFDDGTGATPHGHDHTHGVGGGGS